MSVLVPIAFEGCACRAAFHVGVASWLSRNGFEPGVVAGASSGALVAAIWKHGAIERMRETWLADASTVRVFEPSRLLKGRWPGRMTHVLRGYLEGQEDRRMCDMPGLRIAITRLGLRGPRQRILDDSESIPVVEAVMASCYIPGPYSRPVWLQRRFALDGAIPERVPLRALPQGRAIAVVSDPRAQRVEGWPWARVRPWPADVRVIAPARPLTLSGFAFDRDGTADAVAQGEASAARFVDANETWMRQDG